MVITCIVFCGDFKVESAKSPEAGIYNLLNLLPIVHCLGPDEVLESRNKSIQSSRKGVAIFFIVPYFSV